MDYRQTTFKTKFGNAAKCLGVSPQQVVSLKVRESIQSYREYDLLMDILEHEAGIVGSPIKEDLQGEGQLLQDGKNRIIVVRHETGLEILYVVGSIASIVGLISLVLQCWSRLRGQSPRPHPPRLHELETRRLDENGRLVEDRARALFDGLLSPLGFMNSALTSAVEGIDCDLRRLRSDVQALTARVDVLEKTRKIKTTPTSTRRSRKKAARSRKTKP